MQVLIMSVLTAAGVTNLALIVLVMAGASRHSVYVRAFLVAMVCVLLWTLGTGLLLLADPYVGATVGALLFAVAPMFLTFFLVLFIAYLSDDSDEQFLLPQRSSYIVGLLFATILGAVTIILSPKSVITDVVATPTGINDVVINTSGYTTYVLYLTVGFAAVFREFFLAHRQIGAQVARKQMFAIAFGVALAIVLSAMTNMLLPILGNTGFLWLGPGWTLAYVGVVVFAIIHNQLFDLRMAVVRTIAYILLLATMATAYFVLAYALSALFSRGSLMPDIRATASNVSIALLLAVLFQPLKQWFDYVTREIFYQDSYDSERLLAEMSRLFASTLQLRLLVEESARRIAKALKASYGLVYVERSKAAPVVAFTDGRRTFQTSELKAIAARLSKDKRTGVVVVNQALEHKCKVLAKRHVALIVPLQYDNQLVGYILLGERRVRRYTQRDLAVLHTIGDELVVATKNALLLHEVRDLNTNLQRRIDIATKELTMSNKKLLKLDEAKDEFISMASHQLRTPLTSVKGYISMVLDGDVGPINDQQRKLLRESYTSSERMVHLIGDFLNVSRIQTGRFVIDTKRIDIRRLIREEVESMQHLVDSHDMQLVFQPPCCEMYVQADEGKLRQVVMNFIDNAIYYSRSKSTIVVKLCKDHGEVVFEVHDQGIGVPKAAQARLFSKFYRADNARRQRPDGTGVGLYLAKKIIKEHQGSLIFSSTEGRGSVFGFRLPLDQK
ncbi:hypothetical protein CR983_03670 [Candidatus Saccharibacteria bacterium]|nr:MAG: hypothetical protein CR983_03670 [Candidatus Saccharibacteria bacterium]